jgi:hypothetical protein
MGNPSIFAEGWVFQLFTKDRQIVLAPGFVARESLAKAFDRAGWLRLVGE